MLRLFVSSSFLLILISMAACSPPPDPVHCDRSPGNRSCRVTNSYGAFPDRSVCRAAAVAYPTTEDELISVVANATMNKTKMKVATRFSHSIPKLVCPDGDDGLLISTKFLNRTLEIDRSAMTMTVESGATLRQVIDAAAEAGMALPYTPYWWGLTVGGLIATGAHGSTLWGEGSSVHDYVVQLRIVTPVAADHGYAKVRTLAAGDPDLNAARVSLGVLGVISRVTLKLQPIFKREISFRETNDSDLGDMVGSFGKKHEFADITWYPSQRKAVYRIDDRVSGDVSGYATLDFPGFRSRPSLLLAMLRTAEENQELIGNADGKCFDGKITTSSLKISGYGLKNNGVAFMGYPVVGYQNRVQASGSCLDSHEDAGLTGCAWDPRLKSLFFHQTTFSIALSKVKPFIKDVQKLVELEPKALCGADLYNGILMRYVGASSAYLGKQEDAVDFDITYYRSKDPMKPRLYEDVFEEVEQLGLFKYGGLPHWGKNRNVAFVGAVKKYKNIEEFLKVKAKYDPVGLFSSDWTDRLLGLKDSKDGAGVTVVKDGCALEGLCVCSQDSHCAPSKGYYCRPGKIYRDASVCTRLTTR
ncbi:probable L-gulonolactone oxidase 6 [Diospyros lotus]|uniref:probable L-gulonolactone oxidase 6 n=1 Tax=Diospyros lotus TaxID=55363 RepID=UPI00225C3156|nr:probable L-gulonolactone oxidase 6 [Diospyros lotus]